jgi:hypothetical protein
VDVRGDQKHAKKLGDTMSFIAADEFIILVDNPNMAGDDLARMRDAGVRTAFNVIYWENVEPVPGMFNWEQPDALVARAKAAGMKSLLRCHDNAPAYFPDDWYFRPGAGMPWNVNGHSCECAMNAITANGCNVSQVDLTAAK